MQGKAVELTLLGGSLQFTLRAIEPPIAMITFTLDHVTITARGDDMAYTLPAGKQVKLQVAYVDASGNPATVDGEVQWTSSNDDIAVVWSDAKNTTQALISAGEQVGQAQITATVDADLGDGVRELVTMMDITVIGGEAVAGTIEPVGEWGDIPHPEAQT
jgi:hypothetical protein